MSSSSETVEQRSIFLKMLQFIYFWAVGTRNDSMKTLGLRVQQTFSVFKTALKIFIKYSER